MSKTFWNKTPKENRLLKKEMGEYISWMNDCEPYCQICGEVGDDLHHLFYGNRGADKNDKYLITVCRTCHKWCHDNKHESQKKYNQKAKDNWESFNAEK